MAKVYAGIGSRTTPADIQKLMSRAALLLSHEGWKLRSGGAPGADLAFQDGISGRSDLWAFQEIFIPWNGFSNLHHNPEKGIYFTPKNTAAEAIAEAHHPAYDKLGKAAKKLMCRNGYQILGLELNNPASFVLCWTPDACINGCTIQETGGTGQALRIAHNYGIPIYNLAYKPHYDKVVNWVK